MGKLWKFSVSTPSRGHAVVRERSRERPDKNNGFEFEMETDQTCLPPVFGGIDSLRDAMAAGRAAEEGFAPRERAFGGGGNMEIREIRENKKQFLPLLLAADEQEDMIDRYLDRGTLYVLDDGGVKCECVVTDEGGGVLEIKNIATAPEWRGHGYGKAMLDFVAAAYQGRHSILQVGTGDSPLTIPFYEKCGFTRSHRIRNFFTDHYDHPIYEAGVRLVDMIYLQKKIGNEETSKQPAGRTGQAEEENQ